MSREWPGPALLKNIEIVGFDYGFRMDNHGQYGMTAEDIVLRGPNKAAIFNDRNHLAVRNRTVSPP